MPYITNMITICNNYSEKDVHRVNDLIEKMKNDICDIHSSESES